MMEKQWIVSSLLRSSEQGNAEGVNAFSTTTLGLKRQRDSQFYDGDGKPLRGLRREAASLMYNNRYLSEEELHRLEQSLSAGQGNTSVTSTADGKGGGSARRILNGLPALPDMFGVVPSTTSGGKAAKSAGGENGDSRWAVPAMNRWFLVQRNHVVQNRLTEGGNNSNDESAQQLGHQSAHMGGCGYRWVRADALQVESALTGSLVVAAMPVADTGASTGRTEMGSGGAKHKRVQEELQESWISQACLLAPPETEFSVADAYKGSDPFSFFTVSEDEYRILNLESPQFQPSFLSRHNDVEEATPHHFNFDATMKLLTMYERFGNFVVVADRWTYANASGTGPADVNGADETLLPPPVEALMERYKLVSEAVLQYRLHMLRTVLRDGKSGRCDEAVAAAVGCRKPESRASREAVVAKSQKDTDDRLIASSHPLVSLMLKHPILETQRQRQEWLTQKFREIKDDDGKSCNNNDNGNPNKEDTNDEVSATANAASEIAMINGHRRSYLKDLAVMGTSSLSNHLDSSQMQNSRDHGDGGTSFAVGGNARSGSASPLESQLSVPLNICPIPTASPFWYDGLLERVRRERLREDMILESRENVPYHVALMSLQKVGKQAKVLFDRLRTLTQETVAASVEEPEESDVSTRASGTSAVVDTGVGGKEGRGARPGKLATAKQCKKRQQQQLTDPSSEDSYQAVQEEVRRVPAICERLKLCVQAGWFLPPSYLGKGCGSDLKGSNGNTNNENSGGNRGAPVGGSSGGTNIIANRVLSNSSEALLLSLPPNTPRIHRSVEHELEKHLWEDHRALCDDSAEVQQLLGEVRVLYTQNVILRRFAGRCGTLKASLKKLASDASSMKI
ncbi:hypothetical protein, conserved [Trypanosoma brucei brucei TREU927]|uniref:Uncharacterized protein n=1 Tax=Trypanosoma brucei brucei (strain 927/4 GUTat10.1) TaxID=185431 RepID=Q57UN4_TRYB2|nr:hypothetical protein, conserved [Trypanosoma brucei brucei TREU927]AAX70685.1 hypothetical protein, conserved [Trypanosoma brucei]AAZ12468.1 hypothetical protein, conserved [Trypanosoma brucei brucei TREU927]